MSTLPEGLNITVRTGLRSRFKIKPKTGSNKIAPNPLIPNPLIPNLFSDLFMSQFREKMSESAFHQQMEGTWSPVSKENDDGSETIRLARNVSGSDGIVEDVEIKMRDPFEQRRRIPHRDFIAKLKPRS